MCGIIGVGFKQRIEDRSWFVNGRDEMLHRGPDDFGEWWSVDGRVGLGHRRLAIVDLSSLGHQPMINDAKGLVVVFNGEIYNHNELREELRASGHIFHSHSDTEVLLAAYAFWGDDCLSHLNGMFAFAIYDIKNQRFFLARDRAGEKPLFYRLCDDSLQFASELKALLTNPYNPRRIDKEALDCYLTMGFVPGNRCILHGYKKLPPAHALSFELLKGTTRLWRYWSLPKFSGTEFPDEIAMLNELESLLEDAVGRQIVADVPVGVLLSGGIDSSLVTAMAVRRSSKVRTFSIGFSSHKELDETPHARMIAKHFGTEHTELMADDVSPDLLPRLAYQFDEPIVDSSMIPTFLVAQLVRPHCAVALGGDGGDELFGGYSEYSRLLWLQSYLRFIPKVIRKAVAFYSDHYLSPESMKSNMLSWLLAVDNNFELDIPLIARYFNQNLRRSLIKGYREINLKAEDIRSRQIPIESDMMQRMTRMDFQNFLAEDILVKVDRSSMLNSLEVRAPFLDHQIVDFAFGRVPSRLKATLSDKKIILKHLARRILPNEFDFHRKQGFAIPIDDWFKSGPFHDLCWDVLTSGNCLFKRAAVEDLLIKQKHGFRNGERLFCLLQFELWRSKYKVDY